MPSPGLTSFLGSRRFILCVAAVSVIPVGLAARFLLQGGLADLAGGAFYAVLIYLLVGVIKPVWHPTRLAIVAFGISALVEFLQLSPLPSAFSAVFPPMRLVLGTSFSVADLPVYAVGAILALVVDRGLGWLLLRISRAPASGGSCPGCGRQQPFRPISEGPSPVEAVPGYPGAPRCGCAVTVRDLPEAGHG